MENRSEVSALILAAGYSSRAPDFKPLLPIGSICVLEAVIHSIRDADISEIVVVLGYRAEDLIPLLKRLRVRYILNERYAEGMIVSVQTGIKSLMPNTKACLLLPVDMPLVTSYTIKVLCQEFTRTKVSILYPVFQGRRGHPVLISAQLYKAIINWNSPMGLNVLLKDYEKSSYEVEVKDEGILKDLDSDSDYQEILRIYNLRYQI